MSSHEASKYPKIEHFLSGALNLMSAMSVDFSSLSKVTGRDMWQSTVETGMGMNVEEEEFINKILFRNYECPHCHKKFSRSYYLTDHLKVG